MGKHGSFCHFLNFFNQGEDAKNEYACQLQRTNEARRRYFSEQLPAVFAALQEVEERRVGGLRAAVAGAARAEKEVLPIVGQCLDGAQRAAEAIDEKEVKRLLRECHVA